MVFALTHSSQTINEAIGYAHTGLVLGGTGLVRTTGDQTISGNKTFAGGAVFNAGFTATGVSGGFSPAVDLGVNIGSQTKRFGTGHFGYVTGASGKVDNFEATSATFGSINVTNYESITSNNQFVTGNLRSSGSAVLGSTQVTGSATFSSTLGVTGTSSFTGQAFFASSVDFSGAVSSKSTLEISSALTARSGATITGGPVTISGSTTNISGSVTHTGVLTHLGVLSQHGNINITGDIQLTGALTITGQPPGTPAISVRGAVSLNKGPTSPEDQFSANYSHARFGGDLSVSGDLKTQGNAVITGTFGATGAGTFDANLTVRQTGYFHGLRITGNAAITGDLSINGVATLPNISGDTTFSGPTGTTRVIFNTFFRPTIVQAGIGTNNLATGLDSLSDFWSNGGPTASNSRTATGVWYTDYTGYIGEMGLFLTGSSSTAANNNGLPLGTFGKAVLLVNVGTVSGRGVWYPV